MLFRTGNPHSEPNSPKIYDKLVIPNANAQYTYHHGDRYIRLTQERVSLSMSMEGGADYGYGYGWGYHLSEGQNESQSKVVRSYVLDENLGVVWQGGYCRDLEDELEKLEKQKGLTVDQSQNALQTNKLAYEQLPRLCHIRGIYQIASPSLPPIQYCKYPSTHDFIIGRHRFVRGYQSHQISSDSISKQHCQLSHFKNNSTKVSTYLHTIHRILTSGTPKLSYFHRLPPELWHTLFEYLKPAQKYTITDLGSRNGTWISEMGAQVYGLREGYDYQFQGELYAMHVSKMYTGADSEGQSVLEHNGKAHLLVEQFKKQINWNYYERANKIMIIHDIQNLSTKSDHKIEILIFKLKYRDYHEYYLLAVNADFPKKYTIGCKYDIDIYPEEYESPALHGRVYVKEGRWVIDGCDARDRGRERRVWVRLAKGEKFGVDVRKKWKIRLGTLFCLSLEFCGF